MSSSATRAILADKNVYGIKFDGITVDADSVKSFKNNQLILVLDRSGSMGGSPIEDSKKAMISMVNDTPRDVKITLVTFDHSAQSYNPMNHDEAKRIINGFRTGGSTSFSNAITEISRNIDPSKSDINIVFLTDGQDNASGGGSYYSSSRSSGKDAISTSISTLKSKMIGKNTFVYTLGFSSGHDAKFLGELTNIGSNMGLFQYVRNSAAIADSIVPIMGLMSEEKIDCEINSTKINMVRNDDGTITGKLITDVVFADTIPYKIEVGGKYYRGTVKFENIELPLNETVDIIGNQIRDMIRKGILTLQTNPDSLKRAIAEVKISEGHLEKVRADAQKLPRLLRKSVINAINDIYPMTHEFYRLASGVNARNIGNDTIAKLNEIAYSGQLKRGTQKRLDKRSEANADKFKGIETEALKIIADNSDFIVPDEFADMTDFLTCMSIEDTFKDGDCMCITLRVSRKENAINDSSKLKIIEIYSSVMSSSSFQDAVIHANPGSMGDFDAASRAFVIKGEGNNEISAIFPMFINEAHWKMSKVYLRQILGLITTLDPLGYQYSQIMNVPFLILNKAKRNLHENPSEFNQKMFKIINDTCNAILRDYKEIENIKQKYNDFFNIKNRCDFDMYPDINVFATHVMSVINMGGIVKDTKFNDFLKFMIEEQHRRVLSNNIDKDQILVMMNDIFKISYDDYYKNELINMQNEFEIVKKSSGSGQVFRYQKILYKQHKCFTTDVKSSTASASNGDIVKKLSVKSIASYKLPDDIDYDNFDKLQTFKNIFDIDDPTFTMMELIAMMIQNRFHTKNADRRAAIDGKTYYTLDKANEYLHELIKRLIKDRKTSEINRLECNHNAQMSSNGATFFGSTDNLDAAAGYLFDMRTFGTSDGMDIIRFMIDQHCPNAIDKIQMLRTGVYYREHNGESKRFVIQYITKSIGGGKKKGKVIRWNPTKSTCNAFYMKYYDRNQDIKERKKIWKKVFKGCHDFGAIIGKEYSRT